MARETTVRLVDDIDGSDAAETVHFGLDGRTYEIDLCEINAKELRASLAGFIESGRHTGGRVIRRYHRPPTGDTGGNAAPRTDKEQTRAVREWARSHNMTVSDRGRLPAVVVEAFAKAH